MHPLNDGHHVLQSWLRLTQVEPLGGIVSDCLEKVTKEVVLVVVIVGGGNLDWFNC